MSLSPSAPPNFKIRPRHASAPVDQLLAAAWDQLSQRGPGWYWMVGGLRNGDLYHVCSLATAFREQHGNATPLYLVTESPSQANLASLFAGAFTEIIVAYQFGGDPRRWRPLFEERGLPWFAPDVPLLMHPQLSFDTERFSIDFATENRLTWMQLYKRILHLPAAAEPAIPQVRPSAVERARALCLGAGMAEGRSVVLFPYAQSLAVQAQAHFTRLASDLAAEGYAVFTSVAHGEAPVAGTDPVFIPFELLIDVADFAGWVVAARSGICDITSSSRARKSFIYPNIDELSGWSLSALGLTEDAYELLFDFRAGSPEQFSALIRSDDNFSGLTTPPRRLSSYLGMGRNDMHVGILSSADFRRGAALPRWLCDQDAAPGALVVTGVPPRGHPRLMETLRSVFARLTEAVGDDVRFHACREQDLDDFYEELGPADLIAGHYAARRNRHSIIVTRGAPLQALLPAFVRAKVLDMEPSRCGIWIHPGSTEGVGQDYAYGASGRPIAVAGVQLVEGWSSPEPWGVWSAKNRATLKLNLPAPPSADLEIEIDYTAATWHPGEEISLDVLVDDRPVQALRVSGRQKMRVPLGGASGRSVRVGFLFHDLRSPQERGHGGDHRRLGIGVVRMLIHERGRYPADEAAGVGEGAVA